MIQRNEKEVDIFTHPKFQEAQAIKKLVSSCGDGYIKAFSYGSIGDDKKLTLYFEHPAITHEFTIKHEQNLQKMRDIYKKEKMVGVLFFKKVEAKTLNKFKINQNKKLKDNRYAEKSSGEFAINCKSERIRSLFKDIQEIIKDKKVEK